MKRKFSLLYRAALRKFLKHGRRAGLESAQGLGSQALAAGLQTLDLAKLHEETLVKEVLPGCPDSQRATIIRQAGIFFTEAITPIETTHRGSREAAVHLNQIVEMLSQRTVELAASNVEFRRRSSSARRRRRRSRKARAITASCWNSRTTCSSSCGGCPARFSRRDSRRNCCCMLSDCSNNWL